MLFWIAVVLLTLAIFLSNRRNIQQVVENTGLRNLIAERSQKNAERIEVVEEERAESEPLARIDPAPPATQPAPSDTIKEQPDTPAPPHPLEDDTELEGALQDTSIYFISVQDGVIKPVYVTRQVRRVAPMTHTLQWLIEGPTPEESEQGLLNLVPPKSRLLSASVKDGVAYVNFNDDFRYNHFGAEGTLAQLQQIVYSVTEFDTIRQVQILINGQRVNYLQSESQLYIGKPIGREVFG